MKVTFLCGGHVLGYEAGKIYEDELTPLLEAVLRQDRDLRLLDPPSLDFLEDETRKGEV